MSGKLSFPEWFIEEIVNPNDKQRAIDRKLSSRETIEFRCSKGHLFSRRVDNYIKISSMEKKTECPICNKNNKSKYPESFINSLVGSDREKALTGELKALDKVTLICPKGHVTTSLVTCKVKLTTGELVAPLCSVCNKEKAASAYAETHKKEFPEWFIESLLYDEDKEKARKGILCSDNILYFKCPKGHITKGVLYNKIRVSDMTPKNNICSSCASEKRTKKQINTIKSKRVFPEWFINELVNESDKQKAIHHTLDGTDKVELCCPKGHHYVKKVNQRLHKDGTPSYGCEKCFRENQSIKATPYFEYPQWFIDELVDDKDIELAKLGRLPIGKRVKIKCPTCNTIYHRHVRLEMDVKTKERKRVCNKCRLNAKKTSPLLNRPNYPKWFIDMLVNDVDKEKARNKMLRVTEKVQFKCPYGHIYKATVFSRLKLSSGSIRNIGCFECAKKTIPIKIEKAISKKRVYPQWFIDELANECDKEKARNKSLKADDMVQFTCLEGHIYTQRVSGHIKVRTGDKRNGCNICYYNNLRSKPEFEIEEYIKSLGFTTTHKRFKNPQNKNYFEIDVYIPDKNVGIEYNGSHYHKTLPKDTYSKDKLYHQRKYTVCKQLGIKLISIFEPDWNERQDKVKQYLKDTLRPTQQKIYARKCDIKHITSSEANSMYGKYHLLGKTTIQSISYGLYYNNELVSCMSFQKGRYKENKEPVWCLTRFVTKSCFVVIGGASKLLSRFEKEYQPTMLVSYSDNDYFQGGVYSKLGFDCLGLTKSPRYYWFTDNKELKREHCQLKKLAKKYPDLHKESLSISGNKEDYIMLKLGAMKVYRSGHTKWVKMYR